MRELRASAASTVTASPQACTDLLAAVDRYPGWYGEAIVAAEVLERGPDGVPVRVRATVRLALGPVAREVPLVMDVSVEPDRRVMLTRIPHEPSDEERFELTWSIGQGPATELHLELFARVDVPRLLPVGGVGDQLAQGFVEAARRALDGSSPKASASSS